MKFFIYKVLSKINIFGYLINKIIFKIKVGNYVYFEIRGSINFNGSVVVRDFSEIIVPETCSLNLKENVFIGRFVEIGATDIYINKNSSIQNNCILLGRIKIGRNCLLAPNIYISSGYHHFKNEPPLLIRDQDELMRKTKDTSPSYITIEDDIWIGKNVVIINGVTIGKGAVIGANSLINKNVEPYTIVGGTPQKVIGKRLDFYEGMPTTLCGQSSESFPYFYAGFDYSLSSMKKHTYVTCIDPSLKLYLLNTAKYKKLVIELESEKNGVLLYENQSENIIAGDAIITFEVSSISNIFRLEIREKKGLIKLKKVYLDE